VVCQGLSYKAQQSGGAAHGCGAMQGIRGAVPQDLASIQGLLLPLEERGVLAPRTDDQLLTDLRYFRVAERDAKVD